MAQTEHVHSIETIVQLLTARIEDLCRTLLPLGRKHGAEWVEAPSGKGGLGDSLSVRLNGGRAGVWGHFAANRQGDALDLIAYLQTGGNKTEAIKWAKGWLGLSDMPGGEADRRAIEAARKAAEKRARQEARDRERRAAHAHALWLSAARVEPGDVIDRYLGGRGVGLLQLGRSPGCLRAGQSIRHASGGDWPAMLAAVTALSGRHIATHRTYLAEQEDGAVVKAPVDPQKAVLGGFSGGFVPVWKGLYRQTLRDLPAGVPVYISEGIEDALSAARLLPEARIIAAVSLANIGQVELPPQTTEVVLIGQNDAPGSQAAVAFGKVIGVHAERGRTVRVARPPAGIKDFNDWVRKLEAGDK